MKIVNDTLKSRGKWSTGKIVMWIAFITNVICAAVSTWKNGTLPDLPANWMALIIGMYGVNKSGQIYMSKINQQQP